MKILCLGDSLTHGSVGASYLEFLKGDFDLINRGLNGDTVIGAYHRLKRYLEDEELKDFDLCILFIGTNDIFLPYVNFEERAEENTFKSRYKRILTLLKENNRSAILVGLALFEMEEVRSDALMANKIIRGLAEEFGYPYVDLQGAQLKYLKENPQTHFTIDGVHFTDISAIILKDELEKLLKNSNYTRSRSENNDY